MTEARFWGIITLENKPQFVEEYLLKMLRELVPSNEMSWEEIKKSLSNKFGKLKETERYLDSEKPVWRGNEKIRMSESEDELKIEIPSSVDPDNRNRYEMQLRYDLNGRLKMISERNGHNVYNYSYDETGQLTRYSERHNGGYGWEAEIEWSGKEVKQAKVSSYYGDGGRRGEESIEPFMVEI